MSIEISSRSASRRIFIGILSLVALIALAGCVTHPPPTLVQPWPGPPPDGYSTLFYYGDGGNASFYVDDTRAFKMVGNTYTWVYVRAGEHRVRTKWVFVLAGLNASGRFTALAGKTYYLKSLVGTGGYNPYVMNVGTVMGLVPEQIAREEAPRHWYHKPFVQQIDTVATNLPSQATTDFDTKAAH